MGKNSKAWVFRPREQESNAWRCFPVPQVRENTARKKFQKQAGKSRPWGRDFPAFLRSLFRFFPSKFHLFHLTKKILLLLKSLIQNEEPQGGVAIVVQLLMQTTIAQSWENLVSLGDQEWNPVPGVQDFQQSGGILFLGTGFHSLS